MADGTEGGVNMTGYKYITFDDRKKIEKLYNDGMKITDIAVAVGFSFAAVYRELKRGYTGNYDSNMQPEYNAEIAQVTFCKSLKSRGRRNGMGTDNEQSDVKQ